MKKYIHILYTFCLFLLAVLSFLGIMSPLSHSNEGFTSFGYLLIATSNIGFWGMIYRISKHLEFYLKGKPWGQTIRIISVGSFVIAFFIFFSMGYSAIKAKEYAAQISEDPFADLNKEIQSLEK